MRFARLSLLFALIATPVAAGPELRLARGGAGELVASWTPEGGASEPIAWNLYRGDLAAVGFGAHRGSPDGRCSLPRDLRELALPGQVGVPLSYYYLLSSFEDESTERDVGVDSLGAPRRHDHPCRHQSDCPDGGPAVDPALDWALLHGRLPAEQLPRPVFTATNRDGGVRTESDLLGRATVMWFYPAAASGG